MSRYWSRARNFLAHKVLHTDDTPHAIALGTAIAMLVAFLPLVGFQTIIAISIAALVRANKVVCVPIVWITNPFTMWPIYYGCFVLGRFAMPAGGRAGDEDVSRLVEFASEGSILDLQYWLDLFGLLTDLGVELWIGCLIVGSATGVISYFLARSGVSNYRERRRRRMLRRSLLRAAKEQAKVTRRSEPA